MAGSLVDARTSAADTLLRHAEAPPECERNHLLQRWI